MKQTVHFHYAMAQFLYFGLMPSFRLRKMSTEFVYFRLMPSFRLQEGFPNFLNLALVLGALFFVVEAKLAKLALEMLGALFFVMEAKLEELALEMLDPRNFFWNGSVQPANRSGKQIGFSRFRSSRRVRYVPFVSFLRRCTGASIGLGNQSAIKFDYFCGDTSIDQLVNREMGMASSHCYQRRRAVYFRIGQTNEAGNSPQFGFRVFEKQIVMSNEPLLLA
jgi:hypothetical protein